MLSDKENMAPRAAPSEQPPNKRVRRASRMKTALMAPSEDSELASILERVQVEKQRIYQELEVVKEGAIQAIIEKDEAIEELRGLLSRVGHENSELLHTNQHLSVKVEHLESERVELERAIERARQNYIAQCSNKDTLICQLGQQLDQAKSTLDQLRHSDRQLTTKLQSLQRTNMQLESQLMHSRLQLGKLRYSLAQYESMETTKSELQQQELLDVQKKKENASQLRIKVQRQSAMALELLREQRIKQEEEVQTLKQYYQAILADELYEIQELNSDSDRDLPQKGLNRLSSIAGIVLDQSSCNALYSNIQLESNIASIPTTPVVNTFTHTHEPPTIPITPNKNRESEFSTKHFSYRPTVYKSRKQFMKTLKSTKSVVPKKASLIQQDIVEKPKPKVSDTAKKALVWGGAALAGFLMGMLVRYKLRSS